MESPYAGRVSPRERVEAYGTAGEKQLARMFHHHGIDYFYEHPVAVVDRGKTRVWYPDLWLPECAVAIDYAGMAHDLDYAKGMARRQQVYRENGIPYVVVRPEDLKGNWAKRILGRIEDELALRLQQFHGRAMGDTGRP